MRKLGYLVIVVALMTLGVPTASSQVIVTYVSKARPYFTVAIPDGWKVKTGFEVEKSRMPEGEAPKPRVVSAMPEDERILWFGFWVPQKAHNLEEADEYLASLKGYLLTGPKRESTREGELNGMPARFIRGSGSREGERMDFLAVLFEPGEGTVGIAIYVGRPEAKALHGEELKAMIESVAPIR